MGGCCRCCGCARDADLRALRASQVPDDLRMALDMAEAVRLSESTVPELESLLGELEGRLPNLGQPYRMARLGELLLQRSAEIMLQSLRNKGYPLP